MGEISYRHALGAEDASKGNDVAQYVDHNLHAIVNYHSSSTQYEPGVPTLSSRTADVRRRPPPSRPSAGSSRKSPVWSSGGGSTSSAGGSTSSGPRGREGRTSGASGTTRSFDSSSSRTPPTAPPSRWADASCARAATPKEAKGKQGFYLFYYKDVGEYLVHDLKLQEYGMTKAWVIIEKDKKATR